MNTKEFTTPDILTVATGRIVSERKIDAVYDVLNWMTGESLFTHQLLRVCKEARPVLIAAHPILMEACADSDRITSDNWRQWADEWTDKIGPTMVVPKLGEADHERIDPFSELAEMVHPDKIITVAVGDKP